MGIMVLRDSRQVGLRVCRDQAFFKNEYSKAVMSVGLLVERNKQAKLVELGIY